MKKEAVKLRRMPVSFGLVKGMVHGGPYVHKPQTMFGVNMAEEIDLPCAVSVPTRDFSIPLFRDLQLGLVSACIGIENHSKIYVGCWGGIGRTGLFLTTLKVIELYCNHWTNPVHGKLKLVANPFISQKDLTEEAIAFVRSTYHPHAVETNSQKEFIARFDIEPVLNALRALGLV